MRDEFKTIKIKEETKSKVMKLAKKKNLAQCTTLEYLLSGKIDIDELNN